MTNFLDIALSCVARGWAVIPCWPKTKKCSLKEGEGGENWCNAFTTEEQVRAYWTKRPESQVAITGNLSDLAVLDVDHGLPDEDAWRAWCVRNGLPETYTVRTGRRPEFGAQMYFAGRMNEVGTFHLDGCSGQVKSMGGYVMAAGSIHPDSGVRYEVICDAPLAPLPDVVRDLYTKKEKAETGNPKVPKSKWTLPVHEGEDRTKFLLEQTGQMRNLGCGYDAILAHMIELNDDPAIIADPVEENRLTDLAARCAKFEVPPPPPEVTIGGSKPKESEVADKKPRPVFPDESWAGTVYGEFAEIVCRGNFIRKRLASEAFRAITGAIAGEQVTCGIAGVRLRDYFAMIANRQSGKSYAMDCATWFYTCNSTRHVFEPMLMLHSGHNNYRTSGIGAQRFLPGSANSFVDELTRDSGPKSKKQIQKEVEENNGEVPPPLCWKPTARLITIQGEAMALFSRLCSPDWTGQALSALVTDLYDGMDAEVAVTANRAVPKIPVQLQYSMLLCTQPLIWRKYMAAHMMDSGLFGRFYIVGSEYKPTKVSLPDYADLDLFQDHFGALRRDVFSRLEYLQDHPLRMTIAPEAKRRIQDWENALPEDDDLDRDLSSRLGLHVMRAAMARAWGAIPQRREITVEDADEAILLGEYQIKMRQYYAPTPGDSPRWKHLNAVKAAIELAGQITIRDVRREVRGDRFPEDFDWALKYLESRGTIVTRKVGRALTACWVTGTDV